MSEEAFVSGYAFGYENPGAASGSSVEDLLERGVNEVVDSHVPVPDFDSWVAETREPLHGRYALAPAWISASSTS
jgi:hypothetical protein